MNWIAWIVGCILLTGLAIGLYRGALRIAVSIATAVLTILIAFFVTPYTAQFIEEKTPLDDSMRKYITGNIEAAIDVLVPVEDEEQEETEDAADETGVYKEIPKDLQIQVIENADVPEIFRNLLAENNNDEVYEELGVETFVQYAGTYLSRLSLRVCIFSILLVLATIVLRAVVFAMNVIKKIPMVGFANRLAGGVMGFIGALFVVWFLFMVVILLYSTDIGKQIYGAICENAYMKFIFDYNPLLNISIKI